MMNFKTISSLFIFLFSTFLIAQNLVKGHVVDENSKSIFNVTIYVDGSTIQTKTNNQGNFELNLPNGQYNLIARADMFENYILVINTNQKQNYTIVLEPEIIALQEAKVKSISKKDWEYYYQTFLKLFLGTNEAAKKTKIENPKDLRFSYDNKAKILTAYSRNPLQITNNYLGYKIEYDLVDFNVDFKSNYALTLGTALFTDLNVDSVESKKWKENRNKSYLGSINHFIKAVYDEKIEQEGYDVKRIIRQENPAYQKYKDEILLGAKMTLGSAPPKIIKYLVNQKVPIDSLRIIKEQDKYINFKGLYSVVYTKEKEEKEYIKQMGLTYGSSQASIFFLKDDVLKIEENGTYYHPSNLVVEGYWSWEKIGNMVPMDYKIE